ncbi:MAG: 7,8-didemethyl-8-hydroxy-5-deazariboflavin synthase CofG [Chloroflexi bacterium]|nr:7,8-didemethyl-8-hydroxy-5-deazariboflavin synthase CofG [Chloroflexota bacterium]
MHEPLRKLLQRIEARGYATRDEGHRLIHATGPDLAQLLAMAADWAQRAHGRTISYSCNVFIPLTNLCRDRCAYCTFVRRPTDPDARYLTPDEVLALARAGAKRGCKEALFSLGDKPEAVHRVAREWLQRLGYPSTVAYLHAMAERVLHETGLLPHLNPGVLTEADLARLRPVSASMGLMLESVSPRLTEPGGPHFGSPDKVPKVRLAMIEAAGRLRIPFTTGILIGIGETREERVDSLVAIAELHRRYGHIQEVIIQNFRAKPGTRMAHHPEPSLWEMLRTLAVARLIFGPAMNLQAPPNLAPESYGLYPLAGANDWGGVSPITPDHINPEAPWPKLDELRTVTQEAGYHLVERLPVYPAYLSPKWVAASVWEVLRRRYAEMLPRHGALPPSQP